MVDVKDESQLYDSVLLIQGHATGAIALIPLALVGAFRVRLLFVWCSPLLGGIEVW
jgi:hypothetical protein